MYEPFINAQITLRDGSTTYSIWEFLEDQTTSALRAVSLPDGQHIPHDRWAEVVSHSGMDWNVHSQEETYELASRIVRAGIMLGLLREDTDCHERLRVIIDPFAGEEFMEEL